ncbi:MAG: (2Fe-2S)-binding protein [Thermomicrobiales bacterium]|nr:(2Fe-2S)-binding protein [Thermomicrobiales bacterium]
MPVVCNPPPFGPLAQTFRPIRSGDLEGPRVFTGRPEGGAWNLSRDLFRRDEERFDELLRQSVEWEAAGRDLQAATLLTAYTWDLATIGMWAFVAGQRVPDLSPDNVWINGELAAPARVALDQGRFWCHASDPDADDPLAQVVATPEDLITVLRGQLEDHVGALIGSLRARRPRLGERAMWAIAADCVVDAVIAQIPDGPSARITELITPFVRAETSKFAGQTWVLEAYGPRGFACWTRRHGCCLSFHLPGDDMMCTQCPHRPLDERLTRLRRSLELP